MTKGHDGKHVYERTIRADERSSLSVLGGLIHPGASVLDLGCGSGSLGHFLKARQACTLDGLTFSEQEAALALPSYRRVVQANLETCELHDVFGEERYDFIVCADVLEHLTSPERLLEQCRPLLKPEGLLLVSIPNVSYCGLIAELMQGGFQYREEGLLDRTHLRFFTRKSLVQFFAQHGWHVQSLDAITRELVDSEFKVWFDHLPPAVCRHLLALPDAMTYQFIGVVSPDAGSVNIDQPTPTGVPPAHAGFSAQLYLPVAGGGYCEDRKVVVAGQMGQLRQTLVFDLPSQLPFPQTLRLDPADRPGLLHLYRMALSNANGDPVALWTASDPDSSELLLVPGNQMLGFPPTKKDSAFIMLLTGDDPWFELTWKGKEPPTPTLSQAPVRLEVELGWPMSMDFVALIGAIHQHGSGGQTTIPGAGFEASASHGLLVPSEQIDAALLSSRLLVQLQQTCLQLEEAQKKLQGTQITLAGLQVANDQALQQQALQQDRIAVLQIKLGQSEASLRLAERDRNSLKAHLQWIEASTVFKLTRPAVKIKESFDRTWRQIKALARPGQSRAHRVEIPSPETRSPPIDIIVPVYKGLSDTQRCLNSVLSSENNALWRLVVVNDASPEPELTDWLREFAARHPQVQYLENTENLGFVRTVNRGMRLEPERDVVLLNSDTEVASHWLDRLVQAARSRHRAGTVTPFSNNATICSFPTFCADNPLPPGATTASLDQLFASHGPTEPVEVPTGVGFCMYIRRDCLNEVGYFDEENFGKGYGEENDFCVRATNMGWVNLHALNVFVFHAGGSSFGHSKKPRELQAMNTLRKLHPGYEPAVHRFIQADPAKITRNRLELAWLEQSRLPRILLVLHDREGGTLRHAKELMADVGDQVHFFSLVPTSHGVKLCKAGPTSSLEHTFKLPEDWGSLVTTLRCLQIGLVHFHHLLGHNPQVMELPAALGVPHDITLHDYYAVCPQISLTDVTNRYCGELGVEQCAGCLKKSPAPGGDGIETWRSKHLPWLQGARNVLAPSEDVVLRMRRYAPKAPLRCVPHTDMDTAAMLGACVKAAPRSGLVQDQPVKVLVLGALSVIKGADVLEQVADLARQRSAPVEFHLLGYAYRALRTSPHLPLHVHGEYADQDLPRLIQQHDPDLIWFPAQWPETYSYTLSTALMAGRPLLLPDIGAFPQRSRLHPWTWIYPWASSPNEILTQLLKIRHIHLATGRPPRPPQAIAMPQAESGQAAGWRYTVDYLNSLPEPRAAATMNSLPHGVFTVQPATIGDLPALARSQVKHAMLQFLVRLRASPTMGSIAKKIPLRYQTRIKSWLRS